MIEPGHSPQWMRRYDSFQGILPKILLITKEQKLPLGIGDYFTRDIPPSDNVSLRRELFPFHLRWHR